VGSKTIPDWLAENGWPRLRVLVAAWLASLIMIALVIVARSYLSAKQRTSEPEQDLATRDHIIGRLHDFIQEANELDSFTRRKVGLRGIRERVEQVLGMYSTEWIQRVNEKGLRALDEISAELLNGAPIPPLLGPSSGQAQARFSIEVMRAVASPLIGPDHFVVGSQLFFHLYIVRTGTSSTIRSFGVDIITEKTKHTVEQPESGKLYYPLGFGGDGQEIQNLSEAINWELFQHGQGREGYLLFHLEDTPGYGELSKTIPKYLKGALAEVWIKDSLGQKYPSKGVQIDVYREDDVSSDAKSQ
jgi:hypothetical protein